MHFGTKGKCFVQNFTKSNAYIHKEREMQNNTSKSHSQARSKTRASNRSPELHNGHRARMKKRFSVNEGKDFSDHELLELLLFYSIPRADTNELAHMLLNEFGSLRAIFNSSPKRLEKIKGLGPSSSTLFKLVFTLRKRMDIERYAIESLKTDCLQNVGNFLIEYYKDQGREEFTTLLLDNSLKLIDFVSLSIGSVNSASIDIRSLAKLALERDASYVIIAHNHPNGTLNQSNEDKAVSTHVQAALHAIGINLLDHIIVNDIAYAPTMCHQISGRIPQADIETINKFYWS